MRKIVFGLLILSLSGALFTDCVRAKKGCKKNYRKIKKFRKQNDHFTM